MLLLFFGLGFSLFGALADQAADGAAAHAQLAETHQWDRVFCEQALDSLGEERVPKAENGPENLFKNFLKFFSKKC